MLQQRKPYLKKPGAGLLPDLFLLVTDLAKPDQLNRSSGHDRAWKDTSAVVDVIKPFLDFPKIKKLEKVCSYDWTCTKAQKQCYFKQKYSLKLFIAF